VLFTDIVDSTLLTERYGDETWSAVLSDHRATVRDSVRAHDGTEVGTQGDGFLVRFDVPDDAADCAVDIQQLLADHREEDERVPHVRIGIHAGEVVHRDDDLVGRVINLAARVTAEAAPDEILVTEPFADHLAPGHPLVDRGLRTLKGFDQPRHLLALAWEQVDEILLDD
jgi:class 3 adenylate cyclase